jgi:hypothetical protein
MTSEIKREPPTKIPTHCSRHSFYTYGCLQCKGFYRAYIISKRLREREEKQLAEELGINPPSVEQAEIPWWVREKLTPEQVQERVRLWRENRKERKE